MSLYSTVAYIPEVGVYVLWGEEENGVDEVGK